MIRNPLPLASYSPELQKLMDEIGPKWKISIHRPLVLEAFGPLIMAQSRKGFVTTKDIPYGNNPRQILDIYRPVDANNLPILVFVHGGAFVRGAKDPTDAIFSNLLTWFARQGYIGVNLEYRLAPEAKYPDGARDIGLAIEWLQKNAAQHGGNPKRIFLMGHSAGGCHSGTYAFDPAAGFQGKGLSGVVLVSGRLRADVSPLNPNADPVREYFGSDESLYEQRSPINYGELSKLPTFIAIAEYENPLLDIYGAELFARMSKARGRSIPFLRMRRHNHTSITAHFDSGEDILGREILDFFATCP